MWILLPRASATAVRWEFLIDMSKFCIAKWQQKKNETQLSILSSLPSKNPRTNILLGELQSFTYLKETCFRASFRGMFFPPDSWLKPIMGQPLNAPYWPTPSKKKRNLMNQVVNYDFWMVKNPCPKDPMYGIACLHLPSKSTTRWFNMISIWPFDPSVGDHLTFDVRVTKLSLKKRTNRRIARPWILWIQYQEWSYLSYKVNIPFIPWILSMGLDPRHLETLQKPNGNFRKPRHRRPSWSWRAVEPHPGGINVDDDWKLEMLQKFGEKTTLGWC